jgi:hypothetical protein
MKLININVPSDESLSQVLDQMISGMLPHANFDPKTYGTLLQNIFALIELEEFTLEYYVLLSSLLSINKLNSLGRDYSPMLTRAAFEILLVNSADSLVRNPDVGMSAHLHTEGHPNDLGNPMILEEARQKLYERSMDLYDRSFNLALPGRESLSTVPAYREAFINSVSEVALNTQRLILDGSERVGRKLYSGARGWLEYSKMIANEVIRRTSQEATQRVKLDDIAEATKMIDQLKELFDGLADYGIPMLDDETPMLKHRLVLLCGNEGAGKTTIMVDQVVRLLIAKRKTKVMCGETATPLLLARILSNYIYKVYGKHATTAHIGGRLEVRPDVQKCIQMALAEIVDSGLLEFIKQLSYDTFYDDLKAMYEEDPFDAILVDHTLALRGKGDERERLDKLAAQARDFKVDYPVFVELLSHLSVAAKMLVGKGKRPDGSPTRGSSVLSNEADEIFVIIQNEVLKVQSLIALDIYKRRATPVLEPIILKIITTASAYEYKPEYQQKFDSSKISADAALKEIAATYSNEEGFEDDVEGDDAY